VSLETWRDISIVYLSLNCFVILIIPMVIFYFAVRGMTIVNGKVPGYLGKAQAFTRQAREQTQAFSDRVAGPVIDAQTELTRTETIIRELLPQNEQPSKNEEDSRES
jgi:hypothetical protein